MRSRLQNLIWDAMLPGDFAGSWFAGCRLEKSVLCVPDSATAQSLEKLFGPQLRRVLPDLTIRVESFQAPEKSILNAAGRKWQAQQDRLREE